MKLRTGRSREGEGACNDPSVGDMLTGGDGIQAYFVEMNDNGDRFLFQPRGASPSLSPPPA